MVWRVRDFDACTARATGSTLDVAGGHFSTTRPDVILSGYENFDSNGDRITDQTGFDMTGDGLA